MSKKLLLSVSALSLILFSAFVIESVRYLVSKVEVQYKVNGLPCSGWNLEIAGHGIYKLDANGKACIEKRVISQICLCKLINGKSQNSLIVYSEPNFRRGLLVVDFNEYGITATHSYTFMFMNLSSYEQNARQRSQ